MNIDINSTATTSNTQSSSIKSNSQSNNKTSFSEELTELSTKQNKDSDKTSTEKENNENQDVNGAIDGLQGAVEEMNEKLNQSEENSSEELKNITDNTENNLKGSEKNLIGNDLILKNLKDTLTLQLNASMNFGSGNSAFGSLMNQNQNENNANEENATPSKTSMLEKSLETTAQLNSTHQSLKSLNNTKLQTDENVVKFDQIIVSKEDADFFYKLATEKQIDTTKATEKSMQVSKTLADMIANSIKNNTPLRIDFDNNISVIIKISRDGKISADFLPSSQVAETYLKENLPLLKQKFDQENIDYEELNHRHQKQDNNRNQNPKKENKDE